MNPSLVLVIGIIICIILIALFRPRKTLSDPHMYFVLFSSTVNLDIEKAIEASFGQWSYSFSLEKQDNLFMVHSGANHLILELRNEHLPRETVDKLFSSYSELSYDEINQLKNHQVVIHIHIPENPRFDTLVVLALLKQEGAVGVGFLNANDAINYYPVSRFQSYMGEIVPQLDELYFMFQTQKR